MNNYFRQRQTI